MSSRILPPNLHFHGLAVCAVASVAVGFLIAPEFVNTRELKAAPLTDEHDPDGDGLVNLQENILGTNTFEEDTDHDGFSDLEEVARKSSPLFASSTPVGKGISLGMSARGGEQEPHALVAMYLPDGKLRNKSFRVGILLKDRTVALSQYYLQNEATLSFHPAADPNAQIATLDIPFSPRLVLCFGQMTMFATVGDASLGVVQSADSIHLLAFDQTIVLEFTNPHLKGSDPTRTTNQPTGGAGPGTLGSIYSPLPLGRSMSNWLPGQVCFQQTTLIGATGPKITQQVTSAECQVGWDSYCPGTCSGTAGNTYTTIDPVALIGG